MVRRLTVFPVLLKHLRVFQVPMLVGSQHNIIKSSSGLYKIFLKFLHQFTHKPKCKCANINIPPTQLKMAKESSSKAWLVGHAYNLSNRETKA